ncbi:hypothetical protein BDW68DRAFT_13162 [Aspergillus falconensis]
MFIYPFFSSKMAFFRPAILVMHLQTLITVPCAVSPQWVSYAFGSHDYEEDELLFIRCTMAICLYLLLVMRLAFGTY